MTSLHFDMIQENNPISIYSIFWKYHISYESVVITYYKPQNENIHQNFRFDNMENP